ncbi:MAG: gamma-glutamyltransferase, partial [Myxococcota bacterium]
VFLDFREVAPKAAHRDMYVHDGNADPIMSRDGILAAGVPGAAAGYVELQRRWGKLKLTQVLLPAIDLAAGGFPVSERYRGYCEWRLDLLRKDPEASRIFLVPGKNGGPPEIPPLGHRIVQADMAATLRAIAREGADAFYRGEVAKKLAADVQARGGLITLDDLAAYRVRERRPLIGSYRGHAIATSPPPSAGGQVVLTILNLLETLPDGIAWHDPRAIHLYIEASKRAFADRYLIGDPEFVDDVTRNLIAKDRAALLAVIIGDQATPAAEVPPGQGAQLPPPPKRRISAVPLDGADTTHLCTIDADGNAVSLTTTVNYGWGSGVVARGTGVLLNDEMDDFAVAPGVPNAYGIVGAEANAVQPGKVPLSSMSPTIVFQGPTTTTPVRLVVGSPGGPRIPTTVTQIIVNHLTYGADIAKALALGRIHHQHLPDVVRVEPLTIDTATAQLLQRHGHVLEEQKPWSNATAIAVDPTTGVRTGAADPRGIGVAIAE